MKFSYPGIDRVFDTEKDKVNCLTVENGAFYSDIINDIVGQTEGLKGKAVLVCNEKTLEFSKYADITTSFFPFEINRRGLLAKVVSFFEKRALAPDNYEKTVALLSGVEKYFNDVSVDFPCDLVYNKLSVSSLMRSAGIEIADDSESLPEKLLNYMELVREFEEDKLFITVNFRSFVEDAQTDAFLESVIKHKYDLLMFESNSYPMLANELRFTVDKDLCCF